MIGTPTSTPPDAGSLRNRQRSRGGREICSGKHAHRRKSPGRKRPQRDLLHSWEAVAERPGCRGDSRNGVVLAGGNEVHSDVGRYPGYAARELLRGAQCGQAPRMGTLLLFFVYDERIPGAVKGPQGAHPPRCWRTMAPNPSFTRAIEPGPIAGQTQAHPSNNHHNHTHTPSSATKRPAQYVARLAAANHGPSPVYQPPSPCPTRRQPPPLHASAPVEHPSAKS